MISGEGNKAGAPKDGFLKYVTADISMLSLERTSVSPERYCSNSALLSKSSFNSFVSF